MTRPLFFPLFFFIFIILIVSWIKPNPSFDASLLNTPQTFEGTLLENPEIKEGKLKLTVALKNGDKILLTALADTTSLRQGDTIRFFTKLKKPHHYVNPGVFDYRYYLARQGIAATGFVDEAPQIVVMSYAKINFLQKKLDQLKKSASETLAHFGNIPSQAVLQAVLWGDESLLDTQTENIFRDNGLTHLLVISGMQFGAIALVLYQLFIFGFKIYPKSFLVLPTRKIAAGMTLGLLTLYFIFCLPSASLTRGYVAVSCYLVAKILDKSKDWLNILFLAALVILIANPSDLFNLSFQFSFVAVLSLLLIYPALQNIVRGSCLDFIPHRAHSSARRGAPLRRVTHSLGKFILLQLSLLIGLTPLMIFYFHTFQWAGIFMNLWAVPAIELVIVPLGLAGLSLQLFSAKAALLFFWPAVKMTMGTIWILQQAEKIFHPPFLVWPPHFWELILYYFLLVVCLMSIKSSLKKIILIFGTLIFAFDISANVYSLFFSQKFAITQIDVGQGDSLLVELPGARRILVDGGGSPYFDLGENVLTPFLLAKRIPSLDVVCITHADSDHYGGLLSVLENFKVKELWWNGVVDENFNYKVIFEIARQKGIPIVELERGLTKTIGSTTLSVLNPSKEEKEGASDNNRSIVLKINSKNSSALLTGDLEAFGEKRMLNSVGANELKADYLKIGHHGSKSSSSDEFLNAVDPRIATIGVGENNPFHHPHPSILERLEEHHIPYYRTDLSGAIEIELSDGKVHKVNVDRASPTK